MNKLLILGGTFDPIHNGHLHILEAFRKKIKPDKILIIPTNIPSHKEYKSITTAEDRLQMCKLCTENLENTETSDIEIKRKGKSYTVDTLMELKRVYPDWEMFFITGADMFLTLDSWKSIGEILKLCTLCSVPRENINMEKLKQKAIYLKQNYNYAKFILISMEKICVSSTMIRSRIKYGMGINNLVPIKVADYIKFKNLYV